MDSKYNINVLAISFFPEKDGQLNTEVVNNNWKEYNLTVEQARSKVSDISQQLIEALASGSSYKNFRNSQSKPALNYEVVKQVEYLTETPATSNNYTDYQKILGDLDICNLINQQNIKEVWLWNYTGKNRQGWESNFASSYGDISNSNRDPNDLPKCAKSYTVYDYNYGRGVSEALEDHIHQLEAIFRFLNEDLFWNKFVGYFPGGQWAQSETASSTRRCGWSHFPPNGQTDYDWVNSQSVPSDCLDWNPNTLGKLSDISCASWNCNSKDYFVFWMQNIPGINNDIYYNNRKLRNWWDFIGDFDKAMSLKSDLIL